MNLISKSKEFFPISKRTLFITVFFTLAIFNWWISKIDFTLAEVKKGIIGIATLDMIDVGARISVFYKALFFIVILFYTILFLVRVIQKSNLLTRPEILIINSLGAIGLMALLFNILISHNNNTVRFVLLNIVLLFIYSSIRKISKKTNEWTVSKYQYIYAALIAFALTSFSSFVLQLASIDIKFSFNYGYFCFALLLLIALSFRKISSIKFSQLVYLSRPIFLLPLLAFVSIETYLILNQRKVFLNSPLSFFGLGIFSLALYWFFLYRKLQKGINLTHERKQINNFSIPCVIIALGLYVFYKPIIEQSVELFELANSANAMMRVYDFGEIPLIEAYSSHVLSDQLLGFIYFILNGYNHSIDYTIYNVAIPILHILIVYFFLFRLTGNSMFALAVVLFFPFLSWILPVRYIFSLINIFLLYEFFKKYSFKKLLYICLYSFLLLFWAIDLGIANALAVSAVLLFYLLNNYETSLVRDYAKAIAYTLMPFLTLTGILVMIFDIPIWVNLKQAYDYIAASQAHGYSKVSYNQDKYFYIQYIYFPIAAIGILIFSLYKFYQNAPKKILLFGYLTIIFLLVFYFANVQRGLVRHSFIEGVDLFLSSLMFFIIPFSIVFFFFYRTSWKYYLMLIFTAFLINAYKLPYEEKDNFFHDFQNAFIKGTPIVASDKLITRTIKNREFEEQSYLGFKKFFESNFDKDATFMDFSNTPMLYFYLNRKVPSYFNQYLQNTVTDYLQDENLKYVQKLNVPVVVYSYVPEQWWDKTDDVPNPLRYHVISNYIYNNYTPLTVLSNHFIWVKKGTVLKNNDYPVLDTLLVDRQLNYELRNLPFLLGKNNSTNTEEIILEWEAEKNLLNNTMIVNASVNKSIGNKLELIIDNPGEQSIATLTYSEKGKVLGSYTFFIQAQKINQKYSIPVSVQYNWHRNNADSISLSVASDQIKLKKGILLKGGI